MSITISSLRCGLVRAGAGSLATLALLGLWSPAASAAPAVTITLDADGTVLSVHSAYFGLATVDHTPGLGVATGVIPVVYTGTLTASLPAAIEAGPSFRVELGLTPTMNGAATRTYATDSGVPADVLTVNDLGGEKYEIELPADDTINGDFGFVRFSGLVPVAGSSGVTANPVAGALLTFGTAPSNVDLPLGVIATDERCVAPGPPCPDLTAKAGDTIALVLPSSSRLTALGFSSLSTNSLRMQPLIGGAIVPLSGSVSADGRTLTATVPNNIVGKVSLALEVVDATGTLFLASWHVLDVTNSGLASNTGWGENHETLPAGTSPLVPLGAGMVLVAGLGTAVVLRRRTSAQG